MEERKAIIKLNGGRGALLCNGCSIILSYGMDHDTKIEHYCGECYRLKEKNKKEPLSEKI